MVGESSLDHAVNFEPLLFKKSRKVHSETISSTIFRALDEQTILCGLVEFKQVKVEDKVSFRDMMHDLQPIPHIRKPILSQQDDNDILYFGTQVCNAASVQELIVSATSQKKLLPESLILRLIIQVHTGMTSLIERLFIPVIGKAEIGLYTDTPQFPALNAMILEYGAIPINSFPRPEALCRLITSKYRDLMQLAAEMSIDIANKIEFKGFSEGAVRVAAKYDEAILNRERNGMGTLDTSLVRSVSDYTELQKTCAERSCPSPPYSGAFLDYVNSGRSSSDDVVNEKTKRFLDIAEDVLNRAQEHEQSYWPGKIHPPWIVTWLSRQQDNAEGKETEQQPSGGLEA